MNNLNPKRENDSVLINESSRSVREDFFKTSQDFIDKGIESSFANLKTNIFTTINSAFSNFNNDYERKLDNNREAHEKAMQSLGEDLKKIKDEYTNKKINSEKQEQSIEYLLSRIQNLKLYSKIFQVMKTNYDIKKFKKLKSKIIVEKFFALRRKKNIFNSWRNITNLLIKGRIKLKYDKIYNDKYSEMQALYLNDIKRMTVVLQNLEFDIEKEIEERRSLGKLYDTNMNKGVEVFLKETNTIVEFNSSSNKILINLIDVATPNERSFRKSETKK